MTFALAASVLFSSCAEITVTPPSYTPAWTASPQLTVSPAAAPQSTLQATAMQSPSARATEALAPSPCLTPAPTPLPTGGPMILPPYDDTSRTQYDIRLTYNDGDHTAVAKETVTFVNTYADNLEELYMHIYPNHFSKRAYVSMYFSKTRVYPGNQFNPGGIGMTAVEVDGQPASYAIEGPDETVLRIQLKSPLRMGRSIELKLAFTLKLPHRLGRFSWGEAGAHFENWYPIVAAYDGKGWHLDPYYEIGDPFYSFAADYRVTLDIPEEMQAAYTGKTLSDTKSGGRRVITAVQNGVRDFAFALSAKYQIREDAVDGIDVRVAMPGGMAIKSGTVMDCAKKALSVFNRRFGKYTNGTLSVAFVDDKGGMEYPGIVFIDASLLKNAKNLSLVRTIVVHEIAHQWWYSAVGNDEVAESWLDESLASFSELVYRYEGTNWGTKKGNPNLRLKGPKLAKTIPEFKDWADFRVVYTSGAKFYENLMMLMGKENFFRMLREYYARYAYGVATAENLRALIAERGGAAAVGWFDRCVYGK